MLAHVDLATQLAQRAASCVIFGQVEHADRLSERACACEQLPERIGLAGELEHRDAPTRHAHDRRCAVDQQAERLGDLLERSVVALPGLARRAVLLDPRVRRGGIGRGRDAVRAGERPDFDVADVLVAELLVEGERLRVLVDHLEPDALDAPVASPLVQRLHQRSPGATAPLCRDDADPADPRVGSAQAEVGDPDALPIADGDARRLAVEVVRVGQEAVRVRVDREREQVALVCGGEQRRQLLVAEIRG